MRELQEHIDEVMDYMDFDRIYKCMKALDWTWHDVGVPDAATIRQRIRQYMKQVWDLKDDSKYGNIIRVGSGGLEVEYLVEQEAFEVRFVVSNWDTIEG